MPNTLRRTLIATALLSVAALLPTASASAQAPTVCPATFHVLHDDSIGQLKLQAGNYQVTVRGGLSCAASTDWFARFLEDWDGVLPRPWKLNVNAQSFSRGNSGQGFSVVRVANPNGGGGGGSGPSCARASRLFTSFLDNDFDGILPRPWVLDPQTGTFRRGAGSFGFRVKPAGG